MDQLYVSVCWFSQVLLTQSHKSCSWKLIFILMPKKVEFSLEDPSGLSGVKWGNYHWYYYPRARTTHKHIQNLVLPPIEWQCPICSTFWVPCCLLFEWIVGSTEGVSLFPMWGNASRRHGMSLRTAHWETGTTIYVRGQYSQLKKAVSSQSFWHSCFTAWVCSINFAHSLDT